uniref:ATP-dependent RNA helicase n=1 Tax=Ditylenchus dipsaci TaxID=166011 RepID=A0A915EJU6_9BILA
MPPPAKRIKLSKDPERVNVKGNEWKELSLSEETMKGIQEMVVETNEGNQKEESVNSLFALIVTPTRELAMQIHNEIKLLTKFAVEPHLRSIALVGGLSQQKQERILKSKPQVIVATPGRLWSIMDMGEEHLDDLSGLKVLVVDEIDRMLEKGHFEELDKIVQRINCYAEEDRSIWLKIICKLLYFRRRSHSHMNQSKEQMVARLVPRLRNENSQAYGCHVS